MFLIKTRDEFFILNAESGKEALERFSKFSTQDAEIIELKCNDKEIKKIDMQGDLSLFSIGEV